MNNHFLKIVPTLSRMLGKIGTLLILIIFSFSFAISSPNVNYAGGIFGTTVQAQDMDFQFDEPLDQPYAGEQGGNTGSTGALDRLISKIKNILNTIVGILFLLATVYFLWGVIQYVVVGDEKKLKQGKDHMLWGIIGMAVMLSAWAIVRAISNYFF